MIVAFYYMYNSYQVLCWGVRDMKRFQCLPVSSPLVEVECNGVVNKSKPIEDVKKSPNFPQSILTLDVVSITYCIVGNFQGVQFS